jgi:probable HAF family extracellular repeat protein
VALNATPEDPDLAVVMYFEVPPATQVRAFLWQNGSIRELGTLGGNDANPLEVNERGQIAGYSYTNSTPNDSTGLPTMDPFLWQHGTMTDLGVVAPCRNSTANDINSGGQVVGGLGRCTDNSDDLTFFSAFLWEPGKPIVDLNTLVSPPSDLHLTDAAFINERGEVAGVGVLPNGETRAVLAGAAARTVRGWE